MDVVVVRFVAGVWGPLAGVGTVQVLQGGTGPGHLGPTGTLGHSIWSHGIW